VEKAPSSGLRNGYLARKVQLWGAVMDMETRANALIEEAKTRIMKGDSPKALVPLLQSIKDATPFIFDDLYEVYTFLLGEVGKAKLGRDGGTTLEVVNIDEFIGQMQLGESPNNRLPIQRVVNQRDSARVMPKANIHSSPIHP
jgi:hypothetical protein